MKQIYVVYVHSDNFSNGRYPFVAAVYKDKEKAITYVDDEIKTFNNYHYGDTLNIESFDNTDFYLPKVEQHNVKSVSVYKQIKNPKKSGPKEKFLIEFDIIEQDINNNAYYELMEGAWIHV